MKHWLKLSYLLVISIFIQSTLIAENWPSKETPAADDSGAPVPRGYIIPFAEPAPGGAKLTVDIFHRDANSPVTLTLKAVVNDGSGALTTITLATLSDHVEDNPNTYRSKRTFSLDYAQMNHTLRQQAPNAPKLVIGPGTPLFVNAFWNHTRHEWGGTSRGGLFYLPSDGSELISTGTGASFSHTRPDVLDIFIPITQTMANPFNFGPQRSRGLKVGGQIRSRVEAEGKYQLTPQEYDTARAKLLELSKNPQLASQIMGGEWKIDLETRYLKKDATGNIITDAAGIPSPDPMVDTYYDNDRYDGAKGDVGLRYRWTEGNKTGAWNVKPGMGNVSPDGVVYRVEYGIDTTDDQPETIRPFADSSHPQNPFRIIPTLIPGSRASDFLIPSVKVTDFRLKFKLTHNTGLIIELSLDDVYATPLRTGPGLTETKNFKQLELDVGHLGTSSTNTSQSGSIPSKSHDTPGFLAQLGAQAFFDGSPVLHTLDDLRLDSPIRTTRQNDFSISALVIRNLRDHLLGNEWKNGASKYSLAAVTVGAVKLEEVSPSVRETFTSINRNSGTPVKSPLDCLNLITKVVPPAVGPPAN